MKSLIDAWKYILTYYWEILMDLLGKRRCCICGKREKAMVLCNGMFYCLKCWRKIMHRPLTL